MWRGEERSKIISRSNWWSRKKTVRRGIQHLKGEIAGIFSSRSVYPF